MKLRSPDRAKQRQALRMQYDCIKDAVRLLAGGLKKHAETMSEKAVPLAVVIRSKETIMKNHSKARDGLIGTGAVEAFEHLNGEIEKALTVFVGSCAKYCEEYKTKYVPMVVVGRFELELLSKISRGGAKPQR